MAFSLLSPTWHLLFTRFSNKNCTMNCANYAIISSQGISCVLRYVLSAILGFSAISYYYKKESLNSDSSYQKDANILMSFAAIVTQLRAKWQVYFLPEKYLHDKVTPQAESYFLIIAPPNLENLWVRFEFCSKSF